MFDALSDRLGNVFDRLKGKGSLSESDVNAAMREVRIALLEADVAVEVVKSFIDGVKERAVGQEVTKSVTPGQQVIKIVNDNLIEMLGKEPAWIELNAVPPVPILMIGLQGSGKTTTAAKIASRLTRRDKKKVMMASLDVTRPAAREQLRVLGEQIDVSTLPMAEGETAVSIAKRAMAASRLQGYDVVILDTAGRVTVDQGLMDEIKQISEITNPAEKILVADALTGQDAVTTAKNFHQNVGVTGIVLTRMDGDSRGGAALSMRSVTGVPIKAVGTGEKLENLEDFHPERVAGRILGMGDVVSLVEKAAETIEVEEAEKIALKMQKGQFDFNDMLTQLQQVSKMGGLGGVLAMLPGVGKLQKQMASAGVDDKSIARQVAIIQSMTAQERKSPKLLNASRKRRVASGSGTTAQEINRLLKQQMEMARMMKKVGKMGGLKGLGSLFGGGDPIQPDLGQGSNLRIPEGLINQPGQNFPGLPGLPKFPTKR
ncbi:MAG: signal recognition particle protein [Pseudomonadota bacterium]|nr:signal recognition particle protein [Pseudomonadota bacterium]MEC8235257.1 signal recognition particle protein [Pseudomonadota bacterium]MED5301460.1 signal recognition particle protein [Pseudomonadota bacterium]